MENVLEVYQRPYDPNNPVVCMDETSKQLVSQTRVPIAAKPGRPERYDYEYERHGVAQDDARGKDPQLHRAIDEILKLLRSQKPRKPSFFGRPKLGLPKLPRRR